MQRRPVYMVLSPRALGYARLAVESLLRSSADPLHLHLITDSGDDRKQLEDAFSAQAGGTQHECSVFSEDDLGDREAERFRDLPNLRAFRHGHPCWRKITDPLLLTEPGAEMILLDPDLYFPNRFRFETTPADALLLMWQQPNCLLPPEIVRAAMDAKIPLARHVDIGVAHWRVPASSDLLPWVDWLIATLGGTALPFAMHVEAIVWAAIAMRQGGGSLDPALWVCWHRTQTKRLRRKLGATGEGLLRNEPWSTMKCFHAGGEAKWWLPDVVAAAPPPSDLSGVTQAAPIPYVELTPTRYACEQSGKSVLRNLGYYRAFGNKS